MSIHLISPKKLSLTTIQDIISKPAKLELSEEARKRIVHCREYLERKVGVSGNPIYGITTGFGALHDKTIPARDLKTLQINLVRSHACGTGSVLPEILVRLMLLLKIQSLSYGHSGVQLLTVLRLIDFFNEDVLPVVYDQGSLGASGDLSPLAHLSLPLIGEGEVWFNGKKRDAGEVLQEKGWDPIELQAKEGLALLNGTQFMSALGVWSMIRGNDLYQWANMIGALSLDAFDGRIEPFHPMIQEIRPHPGQIDVARYFTDILKGSELISRKKTQVQDPYSFRCMPQVHGATKDALDYASAVFSREVNAVTDNPTIFPDQDEIISAGNFHGQPLAITFDLMGIALAELGNISERRTYQLLSGSRGLPPFLVAEPGLNSGLMIPQYTAASLVSQNKQLATPASVDSIESSNGQEDHVSMGANAATKTLRIISNLENILAIELLGSCQALEFRRPACSSEKIESLFKEFRKGIPFIREDRILYPLIHSAAEFIRIHHPGDF
ncbi:MAG: histidine ammonia-lyase [Bacteroidetes bacterium GWF2_49_14]|nr:MAG: histidine ammonia-lyase [Bacteroidetes bacterium GWF2_49_14]HBB93335.1 histidine ammonia-lyase [Bacteroidales bacterium]